jgi:DNA replication ATP-dependent helicase Dna2
VVDEGSGDGLVALTEQFRMNKPICALASTMFYHSELEPANSEVANRILELPGYDERHKPHDDLHAILRPARPLVFVDVPVGAGDAPRTNLAEAYWIGRIVKAYKEFGLKLPRIDSSDGGNIAVIAPFRAQVAAIRRELEHALERHPDDVSMLRKVVDTVDRFQGSERDLVIVSLACGSSGVHKLLQDERRLNVAITRARHKLIILGNYDLLLTQPLYHDLFEAMADICGDDNWRVQG